MTQFPWPDAGKTSSWIKKRHCFFFSFPYLERSVTLTSTQTLLYCGEGRYSIVNNQLKFLLLNPLGVQLAFSERTNCAL